MGSGLFGDQHDDCCCQSNHNVGEVFVTERAGGKIHLLPYMMHGKLLVMDDRLALHGSANIDWRSLFLNFELGTFCYSRSDVDTARRWIEVLLEKSQPRSTEPTLATRVTEGAMRLVAPLL